MACRTSSLLVLSHGRGGIQGLVHWPLELLHHPLHVGGCTRGTSGNKPSYIEISKTFHLHRMKIKWMEWESNLLDCSMQHMCRIVTFLAATVKCVNEETWFKVLRGCLRDPSPWSVVSVIIESFRFALSEDQAYVHQREMDSICTLNLRVISIWFN